MRTERGARRDDTSKLWSVVAALAVAVVALFLIDPFGSAANGDAIRVNDDVPFVAIIAADEQPIDDEPALDAEPADEVLGTVTTAQP